MDDLWKGFYPPLALNTSKEPIGGELKATYLKIKRPATRLEKGKGFSEPYLKRRTLGLYKNASTPCKYVYWIKSTKEQVEPQFFECLGFGATSAGLAVVQCASYPDGMYICRPDPAKHEHKFWFGKEDRFRDGQNPEIIVRRLGISLNQGANADEEIDGQDDDKIPKKNETPSVDGEDNVPAKYEEDTDMELDYVVAGPDEDHNGEDSDSAVSDNDHSDNESSDSENPENEDPDGNDSDSDDSDSNDDDIPYASSLRSSMRFGTAPVRAIAGSTRISQLARQDIALAAPARAYSLRSGSRYAAAPIPHSAVPVSAPSVDPGHVVAPHTNVNRSGPHLSDTDQLRPTSVHSNSTRSSSAKQVAAPTADDSGTRFSGVYYDLTMEIEDEAKAEVEPREPIQQELPEIEIHFKPGGGVSDRIRPWTSCNNINAFFSHAILAQVIRTDDTSGRVEASITGPGLTFTKAWLMQGDRQDFQALRDMVQAACAKFVGLKMVVEVKKL